MNKLLNLTRNINDCSGHYIVSQHELHRIIRVLAAHPELKQQFDRFVAGAMTQPINIIFDGPPSEEPARFIEVETDAGESIRAGDWTKREDGLWALRITELP
jgi:hypothetical protein